MQSTATDNGVCNWRSPCRRLNWVCLYLYPGNYGMCHIGSPRSTLRFPAQTRHRATIEHSRGTTCF